MPRSSNREPLRWDIENAYPDDIVCGVDEAGRGPLCGPVYAAACILPRELVIDGLDDSKKLTPKRREKMFETICANAVAYAIAFAEVEEIDRLNILNASMLAMRRAVEALKVTPTLALVDGNISRGLPCPSVTVIGGDAKSPSIAAASVLAKVSRDRLCAKLDELYPGYGIAVNKGYPTAAHMEAVRRLGPSECHRKTFLGFLDK